MTTHEWKVRTPEGPRWYRATRFARQWRLATRLKDEEIWSEVAPPWPAEVLSGWRDLLWAKYQRRRVPFEVVQEIDRLLPEDLRRTLGGETGGGRL